MKFWMFDALKEGFLGSAEVAAGLSNNFGQSADPRVRRAGTLKKNGSKRTVYSKNSLVKVF